MSNEPAERPFSSFHDPLASPAVVANETNPFPRPTAEQPIEVWYDDWRARLNRNLASRSDGRWEPLTHIEGSSATTTGTAAAVGPTLRSGLLRLLR